MGKVLIFVGIIILIIGIIVQYAHKIPFIGKLPGDITIEKKNLRIYFPLGTSMLISIILTILLYLINKFKG